jgi:hypothetical protein
MEKSHFIIFKQYSAYLISIEGTSVNVTPTEYQKYNSATLTIAQSLQVLAMSQVLLSHTANPYQLLMNYFESKGWATSDSNK